jgi:hypothetical protein
MHSAIAIELPSTLYRASLHRTTNVAEDCSIPRTHEAIDEIHIQHPDMRATSRTVHISTRSVG